ncbi:hypothetical protein [Levilactobacillus sp.]
MCLSKSTISYELKSIQTIKGINVDVAQS